MFFIFLHLLLLIVNIFDFNFLFIYHTLPKGITYSEFVHQGTGMIITSIIVAIAIILFYFRGAINFYEKNKIIKLLAYFWVIQNVFMLISAALKNNLYINEYTLTYKRIGVYFYLFLSAIGLLTVFIKIVKVKSNNFLFRINGWLFYGVLMLSCFFNWDNLVTDYNINKSKSLDKFYLAALSSTNLPQLFILQNDSLTKHKELSVEDSDWDSFRSSEYILANYNLKNFDLELSRKLFWFMCRNENSEWKSWNYDDYKTYKDLVHLNAEKKIQKINLYSTYVESLETLKNFNNINELQLGKNKIWNIKELHYFPELKKLDLSYNKIATLKGIDTLTHLECLSIYGNQLYDYSPLYLLKELKELYIPSAIPDFQFLELQKNLPNTKIVKS